ncbi:MAG: hypothetical protein JSU61_05170 [Fidelibacterota bacterium]|nr:MAG: hypothetical protein JSU61_05170 [Candidatus Neomarinimicrobiota bacterium]
MSDTFRFVPEDIIPTEADVLHHQGIPIGVDASHTIQDLLTQAMEQFKSSAKPEGMMAEIQQAEFTDIYIGEGQNAEDAILAQIFPRADHLALFALTMGAGISAKIESLFASNSFALGSMLDAVTSLAADQAAEMCEGMFEETLSSRGQTNTETRVLGYSPGYCGWDISGQKRLFQTLKPERIGITLNDSYLMTPLKSVTGLLVSATREVHIFEPGFSYCTTCKTISCRQRLAELSVA